MFEQAPAVFLAKNPVLTSFASGKATSLVVDIGGQGTCVTAVHDGYALTKSSIRTPLGGELLTDLMLRSIEKQVGVRCNLSQNQHVERRPLQRRHRSEHALPGQQPATGDTP